MILSKQTWKPLKEMRVNEILVNQYSKKQELEKLYLYFEEKPFKYRKINQYYNKIKFN